jgi:hypothetical protein
MSYVPIAKLDWATFIESFARLLEGRRVEIEIVGLDVGDQIEAPWLPLTELHFDEDAEALHLHFEDGEEIDHAIEPVELWAEISRGELESLVAIDAAGHKEILRFRAPLELPEAERGGGEAAPP